MTMALEAGDWGGWAGVAVAVLTVAVGLWQQRRQNRRQVEADAIARRHAEVAERRALATEEAIQRLIEGLPAAVQAHAQAQVAAAPTRHAEAVSWELERPSKNVFVLWNTGTETAAGVKVDVGDHPAGLTRRVPEDAVVRKDASIEFMMLGAWGRPVPRQIRVEWDGAAEPAVLRVPQWD
ncbi:hypothetical protein KVH15_33450 [Streptomyces olivaceus]|uniref:hypothetical protein n=1 Tax=Streptomyces olivaceus TaxID=47716 RepID=UPI001CCE937B|nr:hypothetical protein [Streptomyces olivaceus]MBZ6085891.1 hypothetical protein [Streptomyces olivaceus]